MWSRCHSVGVCMRTFRIRKLGTKFNWVEREKREKNTQQLVTTECWIYFIFVYCVRALCIVYTFIHWALILPLSLFDRNTRTFFLSSSSIHLFVSVCIHIVWVTDLVRILCNQNYLFIFFTFNFVIVWDCIRISIYIGATIIQLML